MVDFPGGQHPPGQMKLATPAAGIVKAPGAAAVLVANPEGQAIYYYYKEGMAAPMAISRTTANRRLSVRESGSMIAEVKEAAAATP